MLGSHPPDPDNHGHGFRSNYYQRCTLLALAIAVQTRLMSLAMFIEASNAFAKLNFPVPP
ncbi:hypothetical protein M378DRAFT_18439 [Amanita muscaria Koide BX008]|uniref:Uncharacterized protein n=1 Tax=Amanita muscaria (strain Koide BX008) TaxID=946122 RepID=A0A0C2WFL7_AMAMK|nr:hypothetical protein M378DRAFT_18439 [Amanita muscaria Koide BX008]